MNGFTLFQHEEHACRLRHSFGVRIEIEIIIRAVLSHRENVFRTVFSGICIIEIGRSGTFEYVACNDFHAAFAVSDFGYSARAGHFIVHLCADKGINSDTRFKHAHIIHYSVVVRKHETDAGVSVARLSGFNNSAGHKAGIVARAAYPCDRQSTVHGNGIAAFIDYGSTFGCGNPGGRFGLGVSAHCRVEVKRGEHGIVLVYGCGNAVFSRSVRSGKRIFAGGKNGVKVTVFVRSGIIEISAAAYRKHHFFRTDARCGDKIDVARYVDGCAKYFDLAGNAFAFAGGGNGSVARFKSRKISFGRIVFIRRYRKNRFVAAGPADRLGIGFFTVDENRCRK